MRRIISAVLALALIFAAAPVSAAENAPKTLTVSPANTGMAVETSTTNAATVAAFEELFASSERKPPILDIYKLADVTVGADTRYEIWCTEDGEVYKDDGRNIIDAEKFYSLVDSLGYGFYRYRPVPAAAVAGTNLAVQASTYAFRKLDSKFWRSRYTKTAAPVVATADGKIPRPTFAMQAKAVTAEILAEGGASPLYRGALSSMPASISQKGTYDIKFTVTYEQRGYARGEVTYAYKLNYGGSAPASVVNDDTTPGELVVLRVTGVAAGVGVSATTDVNFTPQFFEESPGTWVALLPVSCYVQPGRHAVRITVGKDTSTFEVTVRDKQFDRQDLTVDAATSEETINSQRANEEYERNIAPLRKLADSTRYWGGRFVWPVKAQWRRTTQFGMQRYTNGSPNASIHAALDMAAPTGTPTYATGAGRVLYAGNLQLTGGTVVIEHGYGLKSWYYHLHSIDVKTGDMVGKEQQIGTVGSTGFSTGPHLHFAMSVGSPHSGQFFINPETLITTDLAA